MEDSRVLGKGQVSGDGTSVKLCNKVPHAWVAFFNTHFMLEVSHVYGTSRQLLASG
jgi:hypothetical protein